MRQLWAWLAVGVLSMELPAQDWNRATFRGDEIDGRDFDYTDSYFLDVLSFTPSSSFAETWSNIETGVRGSIGSIRTDEFYTSHELRVRQELVEGRGLAFRFGYLEGEDFDSRYRRFRAGIEQELMFGTRISAWFEGTQLKEDNDFLLGLVHDGGPWRAEASLGLVDFNDDKGKDGREFLRSAYATHLAFDWSPSLAWSFGATLDAQLPMEVVDPGEDLSFEFRKIRQSLRASWRLGRRDVLQVETSFELSASERLTLSDLERRDRDREFYWPGLEWRHFYENGVEASLILKYFRLRENERRRLSLNEARMIDRHEAQVGIRLEAPLDDEWWLSPALWLAWVDLAEVYPLDGLENDRAHRIEAKIAVPFEWRPGPTVRLVINPTFELDEPAFGGGNVQLVVGF
ncbi:MAG: hypothetical protein RL885_12590 [Planctomycetota bacterium]